MINPGIYNLTCYAGADFDKTFTVTQNGTALDFTSYSARMQVREAADSTATILSLANGSGITLGGTAGTVAVVITSAQSSAIASGAYAYDLELISGGGIVTRLLQGGFTVSGNVTR